MTTKILIFEDDSAITDLLSQVLAQGPFELCACRIKESGMKDILQFRPDVVILNMGADPSGFATCRRIRKVSRVPILVLSAMNNPGFHVKVLEEGADDFLIKPVSSSVLIAHLKNLAWRSQMEAQASQ